MKHFVPARFLVTVFSLLLFVLSATNAKALDSNSADTSICLGSQLKLTASLPHTGMPNYYYTWSAKIGGDAATDAQAGWQGSPTLSVQSPSARVAWSEVTKVVTIKPTVAGTFTYKFEITDSYGCSSVQEVKVYVKDTVKISVTNGEQSICAGSAITTVGINYSNANITISPAVGGSGLTFTPGTGGMGDKTGTLSGTPVASGTYTITAATPATPIPATCASKSVEVSITVFDALEAGTITGNLNVCQGGDATLTAHPSGGSGSYDYAWQTYNGSTWVAASGTNNAATYVPATSSAGSTRYRVVVSDNGGATGCAPQTSTDVTVTVYNSVVAGTITGTMEVCSGTSSATLTAHPSNGSGNYGFQWQRYDSGTSSWADIGGATAATYAAPTTTAGATQYRVKVTDPDAVGCGETISDPVTVTAYPALTVGLDADYTEICSGSSVVLTATPTGGSGTYSTYEWTSTTAGESNPTARVDAHIADATPSTPATDPTTVRYKVKVTDNKGCQGTKTIDISVNKSPILSLSAGLIPCYGGSIDLGMTVTPGTPAYTFTKDGGTTWQSITPEGGNYKYTNMTAGTYTVTVKDAKGCTDTKSITISQNPQISIVSTDKTQPQCNDGHNGSITVVVTGGNKNAVAPFYQTVTLAGNAPSSSTRNGDNCTYVFDGLAAGTYTLYIKDRMDCEKEFEIELGEPGAVVPADITASASTICFGESVILSAQTATGGTPGVSPAPAYTYLWTASNGDSPTPVTPTGENVTSVSFTPSSLGSVTFTLTATDGVTPTGCTGIKTIDVTVNPLPSMTISNDNQSVCLASSLVSSVVTVENANISYTPSTLPTGISYNEGTKTFNYTSELASGDYDITVTATSNTTPACGSPIVQHIYIKVYDPFTAVSGSSDAEYCKGTDASDVTALQAAITGSGSYSYQWAYSTNDGSTWIDIAAGAGGTSETYKPTTAIAGTYLYRVTVTDANACGSEVVEVATIVIHPDFSAATASADAQYCKNVSATPLAVTVSTGTTNPPTYQWYAGGIAIPAPRGTAATLTPGTGSNGTDTTYSVTVNNGCGTSTVTVATIQVYDLLTATIANNATICAGTKSAITSTVTGGDGTHTYQWQTSTDHENWSNVTDSTRAQFVATSGAAGTTAYYRVVVSNGNCGSVNSNYIYVTSYDDLAADITAPVAGICLGSTTDLTVSNLNGVGGYSYQWQSSPDGTGSWTDIAGATADTYAAPRSTQRVTYTTG